MRERPKGSQGDHPRCGWAEKPPPPTICFLTSFYVRKTVCITLKSRILLSSTKNIPLCYPSSIQSLLCNQVDSKALLSSLTEIKNEDPWYINQSSCSCTCPTNESPRKTFCCQLQNQRSNKQLFILFKKLPYFQISHPYVCLKPSSIWNGVVSMVVDGLSSACYRDRSSLSIKDKLAVKGKFTEGKHEGHDYSRRLNESSVGYKGLSSKE